MKNKITRHENKEKNKRSKYDKNDTYACNSALTWIVNVKIGNHSKMFL